MLELSVEAANQGNTGGRFYPTTGHFGITPVVIAGTIITKVPPLSTPLPVRAVYVSVRCSETRSGGMGFGSSVDNVLWEKTKTLWQSDEYVDFAAWSHPFRITIPLDAAKVATSSQCLKEWKTVWRFEIIVEHKPIPYVGHRILKSFFINIVNYSLPIPLPLSPPPELTVGADAFATHVHITPPPGAYGPDDPITFAFRVKPFDSSTVVKKATVVLERVVESADDVKPSTSFFRRSASPRPDERPDAHVLVTASAETLVLGEDGYTTCSMNLDMPKRSSRWDIGETVRTKLISVRYQLRLKLTIKTAKSRLSKEFLCPSIPIQVTSVSSPERAHARADPPVRQRRHRSSRRGLYMQEGTVEISDPVVISRRRTKSTSPVVAAIVTPAPSLKPILLSGEQPSQAQSISFVFPSPPPRGPLSLASDTEDDITPPIKEAVDKYPNPPSAYLSPPNSSSWSGALSTNGDFESFSIIKQFQQSGRRISTTASEEEAMLPSRSRQKLVDEDLFGTRPSLPSLDALGLGLPHISGSSPRRPMTAPARTIAPFTGSSPSRPKTSTHSLFGRGLPPPFSSQAQVEKPDEELPPVDELGVVSPQTFAFSVKQAEH